MQDESEGLLTEKKTKRLNKGKRKRPQRLDPNNWEEYEEDEFADLMEE